MFIIPKYVLNIIKTLEESGHRAFLAGGCVRDMLLKIEPQDYDVTTSASPGEVRRCFSRTIPIGTRHGTVAVLTDEHSVEVTTFRIVQSGCLADDLREDLARRDFSINAMAMDSSGKLYDPWGGQQDLQGKYLRATRGQAEERFAEDPLRLMRAIRLCTSFGLSIVPETYAAILCQSQLLKQVSKERVREELNHIIVSECPAQGIRMLQKCGLMPHVIPELEQMVGVDQRNIRHNRDLFEHSLAVMDGVPARIIVRLAALLHDIGKPVCFTIDEKGVGHFYGHHTAGVSIAKDILGRLKYDSHTINDVSMLVGAHMSRFARLRDVSLKKLIKQLGEHNLEDLYDLQKADILGSAPPYDFTDLEEMRHNIEIILSKKQPLEIKDLAVNGNDLIELGYTPGPDLGKAINSLLELVLSDPGCNDRILLLDQARRWLSGRK